MLQVFQQFNMYHSVSFWAIIEQNADCRIDDFCSLRTIASTLMPALPTSMDRPRPTIRISKRVHAMIPSQSSRLAPGLGAATGSIGDKIRGAMAVGKTRWSMLALVFLPRP